MLRIWLSVGSSGTLREVVANGHAGFGAKGEDIVCSAASVLLRTVVRTFEKASGFTVGGTAKRPGELRFTVHLIKDQDRNWGRGVTEMFIKGIDDLSREYPEQIQLTISSD